MVMVAMHNNSIKWCTKFCKDNQEKWKEIGVIKEIVSYKGHKCSNYHVQFNVDTLTIN